MCAYNSFEGEPCCGSNRLLIQILRNDWGFDGIVLSDCGAIADFYNEYGHKAYSDAESASAAAVLNGTDLECGSSYERYQGLTMWTPTVNIYRDPRWGRGIETYGEDPYLTSRMGVMVVKGLQGTNDGRYDKLHACAKHFAVHSGPEWNRHSFNVENLSTRDLYETYLPPFEALVKEAGIKRGDVCL